MFYNDGEAGVGRTRSAKQETIRVIKYFVIIYCYGRGDTLGSHTNDQLILMADKLRSFQCCSIIMIMR